VPYASYMPGRRFRVLAIYSQPVIELEARMMTHVSTWRGRGYAAERSRCPINSSSAKRSNIIHLAGSIRRLVSTW
jgi:hypothetical protein